MGTKKSLKRLNERITASEIADYVYQSYTGQMGYSKISPEGKSSKEEGIKGHRDLKEAYDYLQRNHNLSYLKYSSSVPLFLVTYSLIKWPGIYPRATSLFAIIGLTLLLVGYFISRKKERYSRELGIGEGKIIYTDLDSEGKNLHANELLISGKPDAIKKINLFEYVPIEHKTTNAPGYPYLHHLVQVWANCILVEDNFGKVSHGILSYANGSFEIEYNEMHKEVVKQLIAKLQADRFLGKSKCAHGIIGECLKCAIAPVLGVTWQKESFSSNFLKNKP